MRAAIPQAHAYGAASPSRRRQRSAKLGSMSDEPPSLDALAKRYLDLWQDQIAAVAADPDIAHTMGRYAQIWAGLGPAGFAGLWAAAADGLKGGNLNESGQAANVFAHGAFKDFFGQNPASAQAGAQTAHGPARGPAPAGAARDDRDDELAQLRRRIAELEERAKHAAATAAPMAQKPRRARKRVGKRTPKTS